MSEAREIVFEQPAATTAAPAPAPAANAAEAPAPAPADVGAPAQEQNQQQTEQQDEGEKQERDERGRFKPTLQQRFDEITRQKHEAIREADFWKARATASAPAPAPNSPEKPTAEKFATYDEYVEALTDWKAAEKVTKALEARDQSAAQERQQQAEHKQAQTFAERANEFAKTTPDFAEVMSMADSVPASPAMQQAILKSPQGPQLAYHLAKNPAEAARIAQLEPADAAFELGTLAATLRGASAPAAPAPKPPAVSKAPAPLSAVNTAATAGAKAPGDMSMPEYTEWRKSQGAWWAK